MANQPYELNPADSEERARAQRASTHPPTVASLPVAAGSSALARPRNMHQCPNCGAWASTGSSICTECGAHLQQKPQKIRCRLCGATASASLVICPQCGRELQAAPSRILSWGAPAVLVALFFVIMLQRWGSGSSTHWVQEQYVTSRDWVNQLAEQLDPQITIATLPEAVAEVNGASVPTASQAESNAFLFRANSDASREQSPSFDQESTPVVAETAPEEPVAAEQPTAELRQAATVTPTATLAPATATALPTLQPTATALPPTATATTPATPTSVEATVAPPVEATVTPRQQPKAEAIVETLPESGTPVGGIGGAVTAANALTDEPTAVILQPTATPEPTQTPIPTPTVAPTLAPTVAPTVATTTYTIRAGDTPLAIANEYGIRVNELLAYNGLSVDDARRLRVGQVLIIPTSKTPVEHLAC